MRVGSTSLSSFGWVFLFAASIGGLAVCWPVYADTVPDDVAQMQRGQAADHGADLKLMPERLLVFDGDAGHEVTLDAGRPDDHDGARASGAPYDNEWIHVKGARGCPGTGRRDEDCQTIEPGSGGSGGTDPTMPSPEPSTFALLCAGVIGLGGLARRKPLQ